MVWSDPNVSEWFGYQDSNAKYDSINWSYNNPDPNTVYIQKYNGNIDDHGNMNNFTVTDNKSNTQQFGNRTYNNVGVSTNPCNTGYSGAYIGFAPNDHGNVYGINFKCRDDQTFSGKIGNDHSGNGYVVDNIFGCTDGKRIVGIASKGIPTKDGKIDFNQAIQFLCDPINCQDINSANMFDDRCRLSSTLEANKGAFCTNSSHVNDPNCITWCKSNPGKCDQAAEIYCKAHVDDHSFCACFTNNYLNTVPESLKNDAFFTKIAPICISADCKSSSTAYITNNMISTQQSCPTCVQTLSLDDLKANKISLNNFKQSCGGSASESNSKSNDKSASSNNKSAGVSSGVYQQSTLVEYIGGTGILISSCSCFLFIIIIIYLFYLK
jgi:hypothetical protein